MPRRLSAFNPRDNGITAARLGLALVVVASHSVTVGGYGPEPLLEQTHGRASLGLLAVIAFFALSGFLLAGSRERTSIAVFLRNRALRILPGYWLALGFTMLVAIPIAATMRGVAVDGSAVAAWVGPRLLFTGGAEDAGLSAAFGGGLINGSLWTLGLEVFCYIVLAITPRRWLRPMVLGELLLQGSLWALEPAFEGPGTALLLAFTCGAAAWLWRTWIPMSGWTAALAAGGGVIALLVPSFPVAVVLMSYAALGLAGLPIRTDRDLSYGVYVLAYPIQQVLATAGVAALGLPVLFAASVAIVLPLAFASWQFVERPALSLRTWRPSLHATEARIVVAEVSAATSPPA